MTCIVMSRTEGKTILVADSDADYNGLRMKDKEKIWVLADDVAIACAGDNDILTRISIEVVGLGLTLPIIEELTRHLMLCVWEAKEHHPDSSCEMLVCIRDKVFLVDPAGGLTRVYDDVFAIGSGAPYALGYLVNEATWVGVVGLESLTKAVGAACQLCPSVGEADQTVFVEHTE